MMKMPETYGCGWFGPTEDYGYLDESKPTDEEIAKWKQEYEQRKTLFKNGMYLEDTYDTYYNRVRYAVCRYNRELDHYCAYICIPKNTPLDKIKCHSGISFTDEESACLGYFKANEDEMIIGWDYAHVGDEDVTLYKVVGDIADTAYQMQDDGLLRYKKRH